MDFPIIRLQFILTYIYLFVNLLFKHVFIYFFPLLDMSLAYVFSYYYIYSHKNVFIYVHFYLYIPVIHLFIFHFCSFGSP